MPNLVLHAADLPAITLSASAVAICSSGVGGYGGAGGGVLVSAAIRLSGASS